MVNWLDDLPAFAEKWKREHPDEYDANGEPLPPKDQSRPEFDHKTIDYNDAMHPKVPFGDYVNPGDREPDAGIGDLQGTPLGGPAPQGLPPPMPQMQIPPPPPPGYNSPWSNRPQMSDAGLLGGGGVNSLTGGTGLLGDVFGGGEYRPLTGRGPRPPAAAPYQLDAMNPLSMMSGGGEPALSVGGGAGDIAPDPTLSDSVSLQAPHNIRGDSGPGLLGGGGGDTLGGGSMDTLGDGGPGGGGGPADDGSGPGMFSKLFGGANKDRLGIGMSNIGAMLMASAGGDTAKGAAALAQGNNALANQRELEETADYHKKALEAHQAQAERERYSLGYQPDGKGGWTFIKGGPADPEAAAALTTSRAQAEYAARVDPEDVKAVVDGWEDGTQPPDTTGMYTMGGRARAEAARRGFDYAGSKLQWEAAKRQIASLNGSQMTRYVGLGQSVTRTIDDVDALAKQVKNSGVIPLNKAKLDIFIKLKGNSPEGQLATQYRTAVNTLREEFANLAKGGFSPDEASWKLANEQINGDYGVDQLLASNKEIKRLINYRLHAIPGMDTLGPGAANRYTHSEGIPYKEEPPLTAPGEEPSTPKPDSFDGPQEEWDAMSPEDRQLW